ncbi:Cof-type HAD-IIB family hydrolase [Rothia aerolata]|uniref:Hydrolase n=1 Tax=Rothia aerolata TaxID=1812262 RepID=A0A917IVN9_9MICC|nr:Cof-type HAD-IIB family hydrolase [Rothia aerolata]GGH64024.1 hydrolase [Rothia aerolata]
MIKLIASDLDGTLLGKDFTFTPRTLAALESAAAAGIGIVFVTGRPQRWLDPLREQLKYDSYAICSNGAVLYHLGKNEVVAAQLTDMADIAAVHPVLEAEFPRATFNLETLDTVYIQGEYEMSPVLQGATIVPGALEPVLATNQGVVKYLMRLPGADPDELFEQVKPLVSDRLSLTMGIKGLPLMEMARPGMNKGQVLAEFATAQGVSAHEVVAFGDMLNDLEMLQWAGTGYAMASGSTRLQKVVGRVCPALEEDGVAQVIEQIVERQR